MTPKTWFWFGISLLVGPTLLDARVLESSVSIKVQADGKVHERHRLRVKLESLEEVEKWAFYPVYLDDHRELIKLEGVTVGVDGKRQRAGRKDKDVVKGGDQFFVASSARYQIVEAPALQVGAGLELDWEILSSPYWKAGAIEVWTGEATDSLHIEVGVADGLPWHYAFDGPRTGLTIEEGARGVVIRGRLDKAETAPGIAGGGSVRWPILHYGWNDEPTWKAVGVWYEGLLAEVPQASPAVINKARELTANAQDARDKLEKIVAFVRGKVRYVAVEIGIGGFRPHAPAEALERQYGDCKDKSLLLIDLLRAVGLEAHMAVIRLDADSRINPDFASPFQFNHAIVALPAALYAVTAEDPVAGGYLFVDPTQERGAASYLHPGVQDQYAMVVKSGSTELVRLPVEARDQEWRVIADLAVGTDGTARGQAVIRLRGAMAEQVIQIKESAAVGELENFSRRVFDLALPGATISKITYGGSQSGVPEVEFAAGSVEWGGLVVASERGASMKIEGMNQMADPRAIENVASYQAASIEAGVLDLIYRINLPSGFCPPEAKTEEVDNGVGSYFQSVKVEGAQIVLQRRGEIRKPWLEPADYPALNELAVAERKAQQRRIRLRCET